MVVPSFMIDLLDFALVHVLASAASYGSSNDALHRNANVYEIPLESDCLTVQVSTINPQCDTSRWPVQERLSEIVDPRALVTTSERELYFLEGTCLLLPKVMRILLTRGTHVAQSLFVQRGIVYLPWCASSLCEAFQIQRFTREDQTS